MNYLLVLPSGGQGVKDVEWLDGEMVCPTDWSGGLKCYGDEDVLKNLLVPPSGGQGVKK